MKCAIVTLVGLVLCGAAAQAQNFAIDWYSIDGGGGTSTGGVFSVTGTFGQADAGHMSGGNITLEGGFWAIIATVQTPGGPALRMVPTSTNTLVVAWPSDSAGFSLQENSLPGNAAGWTSVTNTPVVVGSENQVIIPTPAGSRFFRLKSQ